MSHWIDLPDHPNISYGRYLVPNFASNSICVTGVNGEVCVISPGESLLEGFRARFPGLEAKQGEGLSLVAPNAYHFMGIKAWRACYPKAKIYSSKKARPILARKGVPDIHVIEDGTQSTLLKGAFWICPPGHRGGDIWFVFPVKSDWGWVTCDSFLNYSRMSNQPIARAVQRIMDAAPGLKLSRVIKYFLLTDRARFKSWVSSFLKQYKPILLLPSHGVPEFSEDLGGRIEALVESRL